MVQLSVARSKGRKSSENYKGLGRESCRRTRKGFINRYNPDQHWSFALYRGLDYIQFADGTDKLILNRNDQAGFRLDTLGTHSKHATLCIQGNVPLATKTYFVTKYIAVLQTSSYTFTKTKKTIEQCGGIVKASNFAGQNVICRKEPLGTLSMRTARVTAMSIRVERLGRERGCGTKL